MAKFTERYLESDRGIESAERDGISKSEMMIKINQMTDKGVSVDDRRAIVEQFIKRGR